MSELVLTMTGTPHMLKRVSEYVLVHFPYEVGDLPLGMKPSVEGLVLILHVSEFAERSMSYPTFITQTVEYFRNDRVPIVYELVSDYYPLQLCFTSGVVAERVVEQIRAIANEPWVVSLDRRCVYVMLKRAFLSPLQCSSLVEHRDIEWWDFLGGEDDWSYEKLCGLLCRLYSPGYIIVVDKHGRFQPRPAIQMASWTDVTFTRLESALNYLRKRKGVSDATTVES